MCPLEGKYYSVSDARLGRGIVRNSTSFRLVKGFRSKYPSDYDHVPRTSGQGSTFSTLFFRRASITNRTVTMSASEIPDTLPESSVRAFVLSWTMTLKSAAIAAARSFDSFASAVYLSCDSLARDAYLSCDSLARSA